MFMFLGCLIVSFFVGFVAAKFTAGITQLEKVPWAPSAAAGFILAWLFGGGFWLFLLAVIVGLAGYGLFTKQ